MDGDYELEALLDLNGYEFQFTQGYWVKIEAKEVKATRNRPHGIKYSLTLHDPEGHRLYGLDNAHGIRRQVEYDHRHVYGARRVVPYSFKSPARLLEDFYREVERILRERGVR
ncbi:MAG: DUF6516 family protein [Alphaproteobacteria bacterium]